MHLYNNNGVHIVAMAHGEREKLWNAQEIMLM